MTHKNTLKADESCLLVVDIQAKLLAAMAESEAVLANTSRLLQGSDILGVPALFSEQYPAGLGPTHETLAAHIKGAGAVSKLSFSCAGSPDYLARFKNLSRPQAVICGIEAHVCVLQTALDLKAAGSEVFVVADAVSSRTSANHALALDRMRDEGCTLVSTEMVLFEWLGRAGTEAFKAISKLVR